MNKILRKDIVIPAGTVFKGIGVGYKVQYGTGNYRYSFGLTKDSAGDLIYGIDEDDPALDEWFGETEDV